MNLDNSEESLTPPPLPSNANDSEESWTPPQVPSNANNSAESWTLVQVLSNNERNIEDEAHNNKANKIAEESLNTTESLTSSPLTSSTNNFHGDATISVDTNLNVDDVPDSTEFRAVEVEESETSPDIPLITNEDIKEQIYDSKFSDDKVLNVEKSESKSQSEDSALMQDSLSENYPGSPNITPNKNDEREKATEVGETINNDNLIVNAELIQEEIKTVKLNEPKETIAADDIQKNNEFQPRELKKSKSDEVSLKFKLISIASIIIIGGVVYILFYFNRNESQYSQKETSQISNSNQTVYDSTDMNPSRDKNEALKQPSESEIVESSNKVKSETYVDKSFDVKYTKIIQELFEADNMKDISKIQTFYANNVSRFWEMNTPSFTKIMNSYKNRWNKQQDINNNIIEVKNISSRSFEVINIYTYTRISDNSVQEVNSKIEIIFDENDKIISVNGKQTK
ncbi:MAG: hypothetical protein WAT79_11120 [Saprospiraceae bacterium]